jgi:hypothetical protein
MNEAKHIVTNPNPKKTAQNKAKAKISAENEHKSMLEPQKSKDFGFIANTLNRILANQADAETRLKILQKKKYIQELESLTDRPTISPKSKLIVSSI